MTDETTNPGIPEPEGRSDIHDTDYEVGQDNYEKTIAGVRLDIHRSLKNTSEPTRQAETSYAVFCSKKNSRSR